jgi:hypothetical protein
MGPLLFTYLISIALLFTAGTIDILGHTGMIVGVNQTSHEITNDVAFPSSMTALLFTLLFILRRVYISAKINNTLIEHQCIELCYLVIIMYRGPSSYDVTTLAVVCGLFFSVMTFRVVHEVVLLRETEIFHLSIEHPNLLVQSVVKLDTEVGETNGEQLEQTESPALQHIHLTPVLWRYCSPSSFALLIFPLVWLPALVNIMNMSAYMRHLMIIHFSYQLLFQLSHTLISMLPSNTKVCAYESARANFDFVWVVTQTAVVVTSTYLLIEK